MEHSNGESYEFGPFRLEPGQRLLVKHGAPVGLPPRVYDTLLLLVENRGRLLEKSETHGPALAGYERRRGQPGSQHLGSPKGAGEWRQRAEVHRERAQERLSLRGRSARQPAESG